MKKKSPLLPVAVGLLAGGAVGGLIGTLLAHAQPHRLHLSAWMLPILFLALIAVVGLHELGHVTAGLLCGFRFYLFIVGPLRIQRVGTEIKFRYNPLGASWGGLAACAPSGLVPAMKTRMAWFAFGGPLFSLLGMALIWPGFSLLVTHPNTAALLLFFGLVSGGLALATLIPTNQAGYVSDGARLLMLLRNQPIGRRWVYLGAIAGLSMAERPCRWPAELMDSLGDASESDGGSICYLRHMFHLDRREIDLAREWLERGLSKLDGMPAILQAVVLHLAAYFYAREGRADAREYFERAQKLGGPQSQDTLYLSAAILLAEGRREEGLAQLDLAEKQLKKQPAGIAEALREEINDMRTGISFRTRSQCEL